MSRSDASHTEPPERPRVSAFQGSLILLVAIAIFAVVGLAADGNWPKVVRVTLATGAYIGMLCALPVTRAHLTRRPETHLPLVPFFLAAAAAGLVSGLLLPGFSLRLLVISAILAGSLLGGFHWIALRAWSSLYSHVTA